MKSTGVSEQAKGIGLIALVAIVVSSMIGSGVDGLPQNMAQNSAVAPVAIAWLICGFGMFFISRTFIILSDIRPDVQSGVYMYAREGFGPLIAFFVGWGYWLMTIFSNVAFAIMVMDTLNYFFPGKFAGGNNLPSIIGASILLWGFNRLVLKGTQVAGKINLIGTFAKMVPLVGFVFVVVYFMHASQLMTNIWGHASAVPSENLGAIPSQIFSPLSIALWCFIGVEGAVALSGRARNKKDVGTATFIGFVLSLVICILVSILPFGVFPQKELSTIATPSTAGILKLLTGDIGEYIINIGVLVSVLTSWLAWTMICAEIPMVAARDKTFPKQFTHINSKGAASVSLTASTTFMQIILILVYFSNHAWVTMLNISSLTVLPAYLMSAAYLFKLCATGEFRKYSDKSPIGALIVSIIGFCFCVFMFYASEIKYLAMVPLLLTIGLPLFVLSRAQNRETKHFFTAFEKGLFLVLLVIDVVVLSFVFTGKITL